MSLVDWRTLTLYYTDGERLDRAATLEALAEYRATGGMRDVWLVDPTTYDGDPSDGGPIATEIDWSGFQGAWFPSLHP